MRDLYDKPYPSLCDSCTFAYYIEGGGAGIGMKSYKQRYCSKRIESIHNRGYIGCEFYVSKEDNLDVYSP